MNKIWYYDLVPLTNIPVGKPQFFTYSFQEKLKIGQEVVVFLRRREVRAIVYQAVKNKPKFKVSPINQIVSEQAVLDKNQIKLAKRIADYYFASWGLVFRLLTPQQSKRKTTSPLPGKFKDAGKIRLNKEQQLAVKNIMNSRKFSKFLLHGVTGSGKTEVYLRVIEEVLEEEKTSQFLVLVPEISLTPQAKERYLSRFGDRISLWHSRMTKLEKWHEWKRIKESKANIVIGPRSAVLAPWQNLKLIVIDEEHDSSFKQYDQSPRYDARLVSNWLADIHKSKIVLGSATPRIEDYYWATQGKVKLLKLNKRADVVKGAVTKPPRVEIVDMRQELKKGNKTIFSDKLQEALDRAIKKKQQVVLFINRRGSASFVMCRDCGYVAKCRNCEVPLVYHQTGYGSLRCHHCGLLHATLNICPDCSSAYIKSFGIGTQRVEQEIKNLYSGVKVARMDRDTTAKRGQHEKIYQDFKTNKLQVLVGTQMITKGWDLPKVALVGIIAADLGLFFPDFRTSERVFNLLTQVAGRTGRGKARGLAVMQTYQPDNLVIKTASKHDYQKFYLQEIKNRQELNFPPFSHLAKLIFVHKQAWRAESETKNLAKSLRQTITKSKISVDILGPSPMFISKLRGYFRWQIVLKSKKQASLYQLLSRVPDSWKVDIDPEDLL